MISDIDIYRSAKVLIDQHGAEGAALHAAMRADALLAQGAMTGRQVWLRIGKAVEELARGSGSA